MVYNFVSYAGIVQGKFEDCFEMPLQNVQELSACSFDSRICLLWEGILTIAAEAAS